MPTLSEITKSTGELRKGVTPATGKRKIVKKHKDEVIQAMSGNQKYHVKRLLTKLMHDFKQVASKRGTKNFSVTRWLDDNI